MVRRGWRRFQPAARKALTAILEYLPEDQVAVVEFLEDALVFYAMVHAVKVKRSRYYALEGARFIPVEGTVRKLAVVRMVQDGMRISIEPTTPRPLLTRLKTAFIPVYRGIAAREAREKAREEVRRAVVRSGQHVRGGVGGG